MFEPNDLALRGGPKAVNIPPPHFTWPRINADTEKAVIDQLHESLSIPNNSGVFAEFEAEFARYHGRKYGLLFSSGTAALLAAFFSLRLTHGDNVIVPDYTFFATASPLVFFPVDIRFADCDESGNVTADTIADALDDRTRAVVVTHLWGNPCEMRGIVELCKRENVRLIEDCSHSHGATYFGELCGSFGTISAWSLQGQKLVTGGEGGILLTDDREVYELGLLLGHYGKRCISEIGDDSEFAMHRATGFGLKLRAHPLAIRIAQLEFRRLDRYLEGRRRSVTKFLDVISEYRFLGSPGIANREPSWYNLAFTYNEELAGVPIGRFMAAMNAEGANEIDRPSSTRNISSYQLFRNPIAKLGCTFTSSNIDKERVGAQRYSSRVVKLPVWSFADEQMVSLAYCHALDKVCCHIERGRL